MRSLDARPLGARPLVHAEAALNAGGAGGHSADRPPRPVTGSREGALRPHLPMAPSSSPAPGRTARPAGGGSPGSSGPFWKVTLFILNGPQRPPRWREIPDACRSHHAGRQLRLLPDAASGMRSPATHPPQEGRPRGEGARGGAAASVKPPRGPGLGSELGSGRALPRPAGRPGGGGNPHSSGKLGRAGPSS